MGDVNHQYLNGNVTQVNGIKVDNQTTIEVHQHFFTEIDRKKLHSELMGFKTSDPEFFQALQNICTAIRGDFMFVKLSDAEFKAFYEIKNILFSFYQDKENHRLALSEEKANHHGLGKIFKRFFGG